MCHTSVMLYHHLVSIDKLDIGKRYKITKGSYISLIKREKSSNLFVLNTSGKFKDKMIDHINQSGKIKITVLSKDDKVILFSTSLQKFEPLKEWDHYIN